MSSELDALVRDYKQDPTEKKMRDLARMANRQGFLVIASMVFPDEKTFYIYQIYFFPDDTQLLFNQILTPHSYQYIAGEPKTAAEIAQWIERRVQRHESAPSHLSPGVLWKQKSGKRGKEFTRREDFWEEYPNFPNFPEYPNRIMIEAVW